MCCSCQTRSVRLATWINTTSRSSLSPFVSFLSLSRCYECKMTYIELKGTDNGADSCRLEIVLLLTQQVMFLGGTIKCPHCFQARTGLFPHQYEVVGMPEMAALIKAITNARLKKVPLAMEASGDVSQKPWSFVVLEKWRPSLCTCGLSTRRQRVLGFSQTSH